MKAFIYSLDEARIQFNQNSLDKTSLEPSSIEAVKMKNKKLVNVIIIMDSWSACKQTAQIRKSL